VGEAENNPINALTIWGIAYGANAQATTTPTGYDVF